MLIVNQHPQNRSLTLVVIGPTNSGKSTLINYLTQNHFNLVSHHPQATRNSFDSVTHIDRVELIFRDTPGFHEGSKEINLRMKHEIEKELNEDFHLLTIDSSDYDLKKILSFFKDISLKKSWLILTKKDLNPSIDEKKILEELQTSLPDLHLEKVYTVDRKSIEPLKKDLIKLAPSHPHLYPKGDLSNKNLRFFTSEFIRESTIQYLKDEVPFELAILIEEFKEATDDKIAHIYASILVNRPGQKLIIIGKNGSKIKEIGIQSRKKIEELLGGQVFLSLHVKVRPKWYTNNRLLEELGLFRGKTSARVWRQK